MKNKVIVASLALFAVLAMLVPVFAAGSACCQPKASCCEPKQDCCK